MGRPSFPVTAASARSTAGGRPPAPESPSNTPGRLRLDAHAWLTPVGLAAVLIPVPSALAFRSRAKYLALVAIFVASLIDGAAALFLTPPVLHGALRFFLPAVFATGIGGGRGLFFAPRPGWRERAGGVSRLSCLRRECECTLRRAAGRRAQRAYVSRGGEMAARARSEPQPCYRDAAQRKRALLRRAHDASLRLLNPRGSTAAWPGCRRAGTRSTRSWMRGKSTRCAGGSRDKRARAASTAPIGVYRGTGDVYLFDLTRPLAEHPATVTVVDTFPHASVRAAGALGPVRSLSGVTGRRWVPNTNAAMGSPRIPGRPMPERLHRLLIGYALGGRPSVTAANTLDRLLRVAGAVAGCRRSGAVEGRNRRGSRLRRSLGQTRTTTSTSPANVNGCAAHGRVPVCLGTA